MLYARAETKNIYREMPAEKSIVATAVFKNSFVHPRDYESTVFCINHFGK
jgi:hypothetical protein